MELDEKTLEKQAEQHLEDFLKGEQRSLITFTGDSSLRYLPDSQGERFRLDPKTGAVFLPLAYFAEKQRDNPLILWHIYYQLALYPDWKKQPAKYLYREKNWQTEIQEMTATLLKKVKTVELEKDPAYQAPGLRDYAQREVLTFLHQIDGLAAYLRVQQKNPLYRDAVYHEKIADYLLSQHRLQPGDPPLGRHQVFYNSLWQAELTGQLPEVQEERERFTTLYFGRPFISFFHDQLVAQVDQGQGIDVRDPWVRAFVFPVFLQIWKKEIDEMTLYSSEGSTKEQGQGSFEEKKKGKDETAEANQQEEKKVLKDLLDQQEQIQKQEQEATRKALDMAAYGITPQEQELFAYYTAQTQEQREQMRKLWIQLVGQLHRQRSVKMQRETKGKLDVASLLAHYPDFVEAEQKRNYKNLPIFSRYQLVEQRDTLPQRIEVSFVVDNSGSMNAAKLEAARKALTVTLLSLDDFNRYLTLNAHQLGQQVEVKSETWFFGTNYTQIKPWESDSPAEELSDRVRSVVRLDASGGSTDDGSCLAEISRGISPVQQRDLVFGKQAKIVFEITDGAASFSGVTKKAVDELLEKNVEVYAFQMGEVTEADKKVFDFIWNQGRSEPRGITLGSEINRLPEELLYAVSRNMGSVFHGK